MTVHLSSVPHVHAGKAHTAGVRARLEQLGLNQELWVTREEVVNVARNGERTTSIKKTNPHPPCQLTTEEKAAARG